MHDEVTRVEMKALLKAGLDRLLHRCYVVNIQGSSYRMREYRSRYKAQEKIREHDEEKNFRG